MRVATVTNLPRLGRPLTGRLNSVQFPKGSAPRLGSLSLCRQTSTCCGLGADMADFLANPDIQANMAKAADYAAARWRDRILASCDGSLQDDPVGSPIEAIFAVWWIAYDAAESPDGLGTLDLRAQVTVACGRHDYRLDFTVSPDNVDTALRARALSLPVYDIGVELDGHEFHERTKAQVEYRNQRDRDLTQRGWRLFHFAGSEVVADPLKCVREVYEYADRAQQTLWGRIYETERQRKAG